MRKSNHGFTLIELLAVIVILGTIMVIAGISVIKIKENANRQEAEKLEKTIADLGANIYSYEYMSGKKDAGTFYALYKAGNSFIVTLEKLRESGYLTNLTSENKIANPFGGEGCDAYLYVKPDAVAPEPTFKGYLNCGDDYTTDGWDDYKNLPGAELSPEKSV